MTTQSTTPTGTPFYLSRTFWVNLVALLSLIVPAVRDWLAANPVEFVSALGAVNVLLRFVTAGKYEIKEFPDDSEEEKETASGTGETQESSVTRTGGHTLPCLLGALLLPMWLVSCGHDVTVTPDHTEICKGDSCLTVDKDSQTITYTQHTPTPPADQPVVVVLPGK